MFSKEKEGINKFSVLLTLFIKGNEIRNTLTSKTLIQRQSARMCGLVPMSANVFTEIKA